VSKINCTSNENQKVAATQSRRKSRSAPAVADQIKTILPDRGQDRLEEMAQLLHRAMVAKTESVMAEVVGALRQVEKEETLWKLYEFDRRAAAHFFWCSVLAGLIDHEASFSNAELTQAMQFTSFQAIEDPDLIRGTVARLAAQLLYQRGQIGLASEADRL
jgi:hypothetical protein